jgi:ribonuclease HI
MASSHYEHDFLYHGWQTHIGLWGNERADELAKLGTSSDTILNCPIPHSYIKKQINNKVSQLNQKECKLET